MNQHLCLFASLCYTSFPFHSFKLLQTYVKEKKSKNSHLGVDLCRAGVSGGVMCRGGRGKGQEISMRVQHLGGHKGCCVFVGLVLCKKLQTTVVRAISNPEAHSWMLIVSQFPTNLSRSLVDVTKS